MDLTVVNQTHIQDQQEKTLHILGAAENYKGSHTITLEL
jgi:hypothetical protein